MPENLVKTLVQFTKNHSEVGNIAIVALACICVVLPLDVSQLAFAAVGALVFSLLQSSQSKPKKPSPASKCVYHASTKQFPRINKTKPAVKFSSVSRDNVKRPSAAPVQAPKFLSSSWDLQVAELLAQITPSVDDDRIVQKLASLVAEVIRPIFPEVEIVGFTSGELSRKKAFAVAVPDVDIVANVNPAMLADQLNARLGPFNGATDPKKLQKSAIRLCTDKLVADAGFKFRRSAFRGEEPKVTLLVPTSCGLGIDAIPINFSVNAVTPLHNAALLTECGLLDSRARELILLVKRWAKDRGICHAAKGHLSPFAWTSLCIFFLQAGMPGNERLLPNLNGFQKASGLVRHWKPSKVVSVTGSDKNVAQLFSDFVNFYTNVFDWKSEAISIRTGERCPPAAGLKLNVIADDLTKDTFVGPSVEDPFEEHRNLADAMTATSFIRLKEELSRGHKICSVGSSLAELLEPWAPADCENGPEVAGDLQTQPTTRTQREVAPWRRQVAGN